MRPIRFLYLFVAILCTLKSAFAEKRLPYSQSEIALSLSPIVKSLAPAAVNIHAKRIFQRCTNTSQNDPIFCYFFREFDAICPGVENSLGSSVILSADGIVVSNYHLVGETSEITIVLNDGLEFFANALLADCDSDLAIMKLQSNDSLLYLTLRDSETVEVEKSVLAIGNPFGVGPTVNSGIVSGLARSGTERGDGRGYFIQTYAPIIPGNSGGALIDMAGRLIGVNTSILTRSGGSNRIGFAIPATYCVKWLRKLTKNATALMAHGQDHLDRPLPQSLRKIFKSLKNRA